MQSDVAKSATTIWCKQLMIYSAQKRTIALLF